ncbi:hypothetical protein [Aliidiomarina sedimenti]|uniref:hypothetical protein n=1 Tax=Aliidiomarina sedimenti TaxID=1933879 RepID=UPI000F874A7A|nr:hypothetical protein [Aliidiomarina sedimenti]
MDNWKLNNGEYSYAGTRWIAMSVFLTAHQTAGELGSEQEQAIRQTMLTEKSETLSAIGTEMIDEVLSGSRAEQLKICNGFPDEIRAGQYDITPESEHYQVLTLMVERLGKQ